MRTGALPVSREFDPPGVFIYAILFVRLRVHLGLRESGGRPLQMQYACSTLTVHFLFVVC